MNKQPNLNDLKEIIDKAKYVQMKECSENEFCKNNASRQFRSVVLMMVATHLYLTVMRAAYCAIEALVCVNKRALLSQE